MSFLKSRSPSRSASAVALALLLAPVIGVLLLRAPLINQSGFIDAYFYSGYGWAPSAYLHTFENTYYGVRFPVVLPIALMSRIFGPLGGYVVLRYLLMIAAGAALYVSGRRFASRRVAIASVCALALNCLYLRLMLWDYVTFVMLPATIAGIALWPRDSERARFVLAAGSGASLAAAVLSNPIAGFAVVPLIAVEAVAALRGGRLHMWRLLLRFIGAAAGAVLVFGIGAVVYAVMAGFPPEALLRPTISFLHNDNAIAAGYVLPVHAWIFTEPWIWAPPLLLVGMIAVRGRALLGTSTDARLGQYAVLFVLELFAFRFVATTSLIETWWSYGITAVAMAFAELLLLDSLDRGEASKRGLPLVVAVGVAALVGLLIRLLGNEALRAYRALSGHWARELALVLVALLGPVLWKWVGMRARTAAATVLLAAVTALALSPAAYLGNGRTGEFSARWSVESDTYEAFHSIVTQVAATGSPASRTLVWYSTESGDFGGIGALIPNAGGTLNNFAVPPSFERLSSLELARLNNPTTARVLLVAPTAQELAMGRRTLARAVGQLSVRPERSLAHGNLLSQIVQVRQLKPGGIREAVARSVHAVLAAWRARDSRRLCWLSDPTLVASLVVQDRTCEAGVHRALGGTRPPGPSIRSISVSGDVARVHVAGTPLPLVFDRITSEWLVAGGAAPWTS